MADAMTFLSGAVSMETVSCILYVLALVYTSVQCVDLVRWTVGRPVAVAATSGHCAAGKKLN